MKSKCLQLFYFLKSINEQFLITFSLNEQQIHLCTVAISCKSAWTQYGYSVLADKFLHVLTSLMTQLYR